MQNPNSPPPIEFRCGLDGVWSKQSPDLLQNGQYRALNNIMSNQEGSISSRTGTKEVGQLTVTEPTCYFIRKMCVSPGEDPLTPSLNPRYLGILTSTNHRNIYRSLNYTAKTLVATDVDANASRHWEMAVYSAGESGTPWAYFACPNGMFKDSGLNPYATLPKWGNAAAAGVVLASLVKGTDDVTSIVGSAMAGATLVWTGVIVTLADPAGLSDFDQVTFTGTPGVTVTTTDGRTDLVAGSPWDIRIGVPDANLNIQNGSTTFRIFDTNGQAVLLDTGSYPGTGASITDVPLAGNLDGGAESSPNDTQPYDWVVTYEETVTGDQGNPSQIMAGEGTASVTDSGIVYKSQKVAVHGGQVKLLVWYSADPRIGFVRIYRRGGTLSDEIGRLIARIPNVASSIGAETYTTIVDNASDPDVVFSEQWETDNEPPVVSTVLSPITYTTLSGISAGWQTVTVSGFAAVAAAMGGTGAGALIHINDATGGTSEDVYASQVTATSFRAFFQFPHSTGATITVNAIYGQNCNLVAIIGEAVVVAGDPNNPHIVYKNRNGYPQSFPIGSDATGAVTSIAAGTPANGIVNITECRGQILTLNVSCLYEIAVIQGSLIQPAVVSYKGLKGQSAWCKTPGGEVWYLSDDGVYSWDGAQPRKRSEQIDPIFRGEQYAGISPISMAPSDLNAARMEWHRGMIHLVYVNLAGQTRELVCEPAYRDRWIPYNEEFYETSLPEYPTTMLYQEPDTQSMVVAVNNPLLGATFGIADVVTIIGGLNTTRDWWTAPDSPPFTSGNMIPWDIVMPWFDMGDPTGMKLFEEVWLDIDPQLYNGVYNWNPFINVDLLLNYSDTVVDTFKIKIPSGSSFKGRQLLSLLPNLVNTSGSVYQSYGREARSISFHLSGEAYPAQFQLFRILFQFQPTGLLSAGSASDWMDLGGLTDKRLYQMTVIFDTAGTDRQLVLEMRGGRDGKTAGTPQVFTLSSPTDLGSGRCLKVIPLAVPTIGKLFRVRPYASASIDTGQANSTIDLWRILKVEFPQAEIYPPDIVNVTPPENGGSEYDKYLNQVDLEVNTNGVAVTVQIMADGAAIGPSFTVTSTESDRQRNITMPTGLKGKRWWIFVDASQAALTSGTGMFQLFNHRFIFQPADKGEVAHTFDWDDLGHPWDKYLRSVTVEWDTTGGADVTLQLDVLQGFISGGQAPTLDILSANPIVLTGGRGKVEFPLPPDTISKMVRLHPKGSTIPVIFKQWRYYFDKIDYPQDTVLSTPWQDAETNSDKNPSWVWVDADTQNVPVTIALKNELGTVMTFTHTGTVTDRKKNYPVPVDQVAKMWRLLITNPEPTGKFQLFGNGFRRWAPFDQLGHEDPPEVVLWTPWSDFGWPYDKIARNLVLTVDTGGIVVPVHLQTQEDGTVYTFPNISGTYDDRRVVRACPTNLIGKQWRLVIDSPLPTGAKFKLWDWSLDHVKEPAAITLWSSYEQAFGYVGWKYLKQMWVQYQCPVPLCVLIISETGSFTQTLPAHASRTEERFYLPNRFGSGLNKSRIYSVMFYTRSNDRFKIYADASGLEWLPLGDRHGNYTRMTLTELMPVPI